MKALEKAIRRIKIELEKPMPPPRIPQPPPKKGRKKLHVEEKQLSLPLDSAKPKARRIRLLKRSR